MSTSFVTFKLLTQLRKQWNLFKAVVYPGPEPEEENVPDGMTFRSKLRRFNLIFREYYLHIGRARMTLNIEGVQRGPGLQRHRRRAMEAR